ncbi:MAG: VWA domain-containing protein [Acidaminococcales bacterium]|jgi:hypothetical protein|nr:VWA domain-containing protein [Acidaminococcales bacterium]
MINLSVICPEMAVRVARIETTEEFLSLHAFAEVDADTPFVFLEDEKEGYDIRFNMEKVKSLHRASWLRDYTTHEVLLEGFIIRQIARLRYSVQRDAFDENFQTHSIKIGKSPLYFVVYEILFSAMNEYRLCLEFPELARRLELFSSAVVFSHVSKLKSMGADFSIFIPYADALEKLVRYNSISGEVDMEFINFCLPLCLSAKRTGYANVIAAASLIEEWLHEATYVIAAVQAKAGKPILGEHASWSKDVSARGKEELDAIDRNARLLSVKAKLEDVAKEVGLQAGSGSLKHKTNETTLFFLDTIRKYHKEISELEYMFKRAFTSMKIVDSFDGDVNLCKQQAAYLSSITMEDVKVYQYYRQRKVSVDVMILRDISGSTFLFEKEYAEGIVEILAAVNNFKGIRTLEIDFAGEAKINKGFSQSIETASLSPVSGGGTNLLPAVRLLKGQTFKGRRRLLFILSDGEINDRAQAEQELTDFCAKNEVEMFKIALGDFANNGYERTAMRNLHKLIAKKILERGGAEDA